jgi:hypothetical protein
MIRVAQWAVLCSAFLENKYILNSSMMIRDRCSPVSSTMILDRCNPVSSPRETGQCSLFLLKTCADSSLLWINDR